MNRSFHCWRGRGAASAALVLLFPSLLLAGGGQWTVVAWNNLGMHCMDDDYSVFSILPPFNTINAQVMDAAGKLITDPTSAGITVTYHAVASPDGSINTTSAGKTNFYDYAAVLFGANVGMDQGLAGKAMPGAGNTPQTMNWVGGMNWFEAAGIPVCPKDDAGNKNPYPLMRVTVKNASNIVLASADIVVPVSDEMDCRACHKSGSGTAAMPAAGWVNDPNDKRDFRLNILRLHDEKNAADPNYATALATMGYPPQGLYHSVTNANKQVLCAACHASEALGTGGAAGVKALTAAMHSKHATVTNPTNGLQLDNVLSRNSCYLCHPGSTTRCLRGAMGSAVNASDGSLVMQCQSCHGQMSDVGSAARTGWLMEPNCQACHSGDAEANEGAIRFTSVFTAPGVMRVPANQRFATNVNTPAAGLSLFRFSKGHGGLVCSACHGSTHAEYPSLHRDDNLYSWNKQGHRGKLADCTVCHASMPANSVGGPHGIHPIGSQTWVKDHADIARAISPNYTACRECHGADLRGTALSRAQADRALSTKFGPFTVKRGMEVSCYYCHNGPGSSNVTTHTGPTVANAQLTVPKDTPTSITLTASGTNPQLRVIQQPTHGTVGIAAKVATYFPDAAYQGPDVFTYIASDSGSFVDSQPATVSVTVGGTDYSRDSDGDGLSDWIEYALGLDPLLRTSLLPQQLFESASGTSYLALRVFRGPLLPADMSTSIQVSGDLVHWTPATVITNSAGELKARDTTPANAAPSRFIRVEAVRTTPGP
jgi:cytochrome c1